jgi:hypothetical protein
MEPIEELYLERTIDGGEQILYSNDAMRPFSLLNLVLTREQSKNLGDPHVIRVQVEAFNG